MTAIAFTESALQQAALGWLEAIVWHIALNTPPVDRADCGELTLARRLRDAPARLNPTLPAETLEEAFCKLTRPPDGDPIQRNRALHPLLVDGGRSSTAIRDGRVRGGQGL